MQPGATTQSGFDPRAAIASLFAHGAAFGAVALAASLGGAAAPPPEHAIELIEIAIVTPVNAPAAAPVAAAEAVQAVSPDPVPVEEALRAETPIEPPSPVVEPEPTPVEIREPIPEPELPPVQKAEIPPPPPPVAKPVPKPRPKPVAQKPVEAAPAPAIIEAPAPVQAAAPAPAPAPIAIMPAPNFENEAPAQTAAIAAPAAREILVTTDARFRARPVAPEYPPRARQMGVEGTTVLRALVGETGDTLELIVWQGSGMRLLDEAALAAARQWRFEPARRGDRLMTAWVEVPVRFILR
ncbi:MAG: energy transducer TonB [Proteobacteria bacterium]|nr:energy transducer TonB [Pseudomonadota bacterium]